ncbi:MAG: asparagine synthase-related protein [Aureliella sp.]
MTQHKLVERLVNLMDPARNIVLNMSLDEATRRVGSGDVDQVRQIDGQYALLHKQGKIIRMARSVGRPMRFFLAKQAAGPLLIVAERIDEIRDYLAQEGLLDQFHPSYTRMVPAHYVSELSLLGCPDPSPTQRRYLRSQPNRLPTDVDEIGRAYVGALADEIDRWIGSLPAQAPIGVLFSGGVDSGTVLLATYQVLLNRGLSPARLKAFTLTVDGRGRDLQQARDFLNAVELDYLLEPISVTPQQIDFREAIRVIEDYKPLDVQAATMTIALTRGIRSRYPDWKYLVDGDGGDENLRDYPIEANSELTIRSVLSNPFFYHEGWGVDKVKHSLTYSGGQSRGHVRTYAPAAQLGFHAFSPLATPNVIDLAEGIPFVALTDWDHQRLYDLKGSVCRRGIEQLTGLTMPVFEKNRFQQGAVDSDQFAALFPASPAVYRTVFAELHG